jgi:hypothetical protein
MQYQNSCLKNIDKLILDKLRHPVLAVIQNLFNATSVLRVSGHLSFTTTADVALMDIGMFAKTVGREVPSVRKRRILWSSV